MKTAIIIHGWDGKPKLGWFAWLEEELKKKGLKVIKPNMPNPEEPEIGAWLKKLSSLVKTADKETFFVGHSMGCQTILRFLEKSDFKKIGGIILVAGFMTLTEFTYTETPEFEEDMRRIAKPWVTTKIDFKKIRDKTDNIVCIFSDNDPFVDLKNSKIFEKELGAKIIIEHNKGHFEEANTKTIPAVLKEMERISKTK
jgi:uncharacterized protein